MSDFQTSVNSHNPIGVEGDFASANPRASAYAGEGGLIAGPEGVTVGRFGWIDADGVTVHNFGDGVSAPDGYIHREQQALITGYLQGSSNVIPGGFPITLMTEGDFLVIARANAATKGAQVFASYADGTPQIGAAPAGATATGSIGATFTATGSVANGLNVITASAVTGLISVGDTVTGAGIPAGTAIAKFISGVAGGAGVYQVTNPTTIAAATATCFGDVVDVTAVGSGVLAVGDPIAGTNVPAGATLASQVSGAAGGVGIYTIEVPATQYVASTALTTVGGVLTKWTARRVAELGSLTAISTW